MCQSNIYGGKLKYTSSIVLDTDMKTKELDLKETHKYLDIEEDGIQHGKMKVGVMYSVYVHQFSDFSICSLYFF